jgi:hypothetical protein
MSSLNGCVKTSLSIDTFANVLLRFFMLEGELYDFQRLDDDDDDDELIYNFANFIFSVFYIHNYNIKN